VTTSGWERKTVSGAPSNDADVFSVLRRSGSPSISMSIVGIHDRWSHPASSASEMAGSPR